MPSPQRHPARTITLRPTRFLLAPVVGAILAMGQAQAADTLDTACKKDGNALFDGRDGLTSLRGLRDQFRDALALVEPYRSVAP